MVSIDTLAQLLGRPAGDLVRLDERPLVFAFIDGTFEAHTLRIGSTNEIIRVVTSSNGDLADPAELRLRSAEQLARYSAKMSPQLRNVVERHPEIERVRVRVERIDPSVHRSDRLRTLSVRELTTMVADSAVRYVELVDEPDVLDDD